MKYNFTERLNPEHLGRLHALQPPKKRQYQHAGIPDGLCSELGLGYAITRDIYVSPFLKFYPSDLTIAETTANLMTTFSIL